MRHRFTNQLLTAYKDPLYEKIATASCPTPSRCLPLSPNNAEEMLDALLMENELTCNLHILRSKINKQKFFDKNFYPILLFYLGVVTLKDRFSMTLPNLTTRSIYMKSLLAMLK